MSAVAMQVASRRPGQAGSLTGGRALTRLAMRRDRILLPVWAYAVVGTSVSGVYALKHLYNTPADRAALAAGVYSDRALAFLYGQLHGSSLGAIMAWRYLAYLSLAAGLMSIFLVVRHTRADEETGRLELIGSTVVGRHAPLAAALTVVLTANLLVFALTAAVLMAAGLPAAGAVAFGLGELGCGLVMAALAVIAAQVSGTARGARGLAIAALAVFFFLRGAGDSGGSHGLSWLTWLSPIGWGELLRPFAAERWWVLAAPAVATVLGVATAFILAAYRDHGSGMVQPRPGSPTAGRLLAGPVGLDWRMMRGSIAGWTTGFLAGGLAIGVVANGIGQLIGGSGGTVGKALAKIGGQAALTNAYLAACMTLSGLVAGAFAVAAVLRLRSEEADGRAEPMLAAPISRLRWAGSHYLVVAVATTAVLVAAGVAMALGYGIASSTLSTQLPRLIEAGLVQVPAALAVAAVAAAAAGLVPRASVPIGWTAVAACVVIGVFGPVLNLPQTVLDISPFTHVPKMPGGTLTATPLVWLIVAVLGLAAAGLAGLRRRDIG
jgi:ABC-2 type transport system permease protein